MDDIIEILDSDMILRNPAKLSLIDYWKEVLHCSVGWHYDLDIIWILNKIEESRLSKGSLIMDAGGGNGLLQFILSSLGYNIFSIDSSYRSVPFPASLIFDINKSNVTSGGTSKQYNYSNHFFNLHNILRLLNNPISHLYYFLNKLSFFKSSYFYNELLKRIRNNYGEITFVKCDFTDLSIFNDNYFDCIVSVSALEHNDRNNIRKSVNEFQRVLNNNSHMFLTVSASKSSDWFFKPCLGWCLSEKSIRFLFDIPDASSNFENYDLLFDKLRKSAIIKSRIDKSYFRSGDNGLPWGKYEPKYQPVGIARSVK